MHASVLTNVERREMKSKSAHFAQNWIEHQFAQILAAVGCQALADQREITFEFAGGVVRLGIGKGFAAVTQPYDHQVQQATIEFSAGNPRLARRLVAHLSVIVREPRSDGFRNRHLTAGSAELIRSAFQFRDVVGKDRVPGSLQRFTRGAGCDEGIAIAVAADPGPEGEKSGKVAVVDIEIVDLAKRLGEFVVN